LLVEEDARYESTRDDFRGLPEYVSIRSAGRVSLGAGTLMKVSLEMGITPPVLLRGAV